MYMIRCVFIMFTTYVLSLMSGDGWLSVAKVSFTSPGRPTDIGIQLGKACYPCSK